MASKSLVQTFGLSLTHIRLRVPKLHNVVQFYTERFGMAAIAKLQNDASQEEVHLVGFTGTKDVTMDKKVAFLELVSPQGDAGTSHRNYGKSDSVYWKVGVCLPDVDKAQASLCQHGVKVTPPSQLRDIGYLCHLQDPANFSLEILQFWFKGNTKPYPGLPTHPLGQQPLLGMVTLRVKDIEASLRFYKDTLGMQLICTEDISVFGFHLYFLAFTEEKPPNAEDLGAVENREWTYQRPYTVLELQANVEPLESLKYQDMELDSYGFLGLGFGTTDVQSLQAYLVQEGANPSSITQDPTLQTTSFTVRDPDGSPLRISQF